MMNPEHERQAMVLLRILSAQGFTFVRPEEYQAQQIEEAIFGILAK